MGDKEGKGNEGKGNGGGILALLMSTLWVLASCSGPAGSSPGPFSGYVEGYVLRGGSISPSGEGSPSSAISCGSPAGYEPIAGASVSLLASSYSTTTNSSGFFRLYALQGSGTLSVSGTGYKTTTYPVIIPETGPAGFGTQNCISLPRDDTTALATSISQVDTSVPSAIEVFSAVADVTGKQVLGMPANSFSVRIGDENGLNFQPISILSVQQLTGSGEAYEPFSAVLVLDASDSMNNPAGGGKRKIDLAREAAEYFIQHKASGDEVALIIFDHRITFHQDFTTNSAVLLQALKSYDPDDPGYKWGGSTAYYDAAYEGTQRLNPRSTRRKYNITLTDGLDNSSVHTYMEVILTAHNAGIPVYTVGVGPDADKLILKNIADGTGGQFTEVNDATKIPDAFAGILTQAQYTYRLMLNTSGLSTGQHTIELAVKFAGITGIAYQIFTQP